MLVRHARHLLDLRRLPDGAATTIDTLLDDEQP